MSQGASRVQCSVGLPRTHQHIWEVRDQSTSPGLLLRRGCGLAEAQWGPEGYGCSACKQSPGSSPGAGRTSGPLLPPAPECPQAKAFIN